MQLEDYFDFHAADDIRIKSTRIGIESVLYEHIHRGQNPESIQRRFPSLNLEQVYATILYYLRDRERVGTYVANWLDYGEVKRQEQEHCPPSSLLRLRALHSAQSAPSFEA